MTGWYAHVDLEERTEGLSLHHRMSVHVFKGGGINLRRFLTFGREVAERKVDQVRNGSYDEQFLPRDPCLRKPRHIRGSQRTVE
uniref:Uncharacterized protein n=1 Tax=Rhipicephalus zambeziensis TaxID=60191 RepID=A0A224YAL0_9ACAR